MDTRRVYVRFRGRITGPFSDEEIRRMVDRGQVTRMHELSGDRSTWKRAGQVKQLFEAPVETPSFLDESPAYAESEAEAVVPEEREPVWYYARDGREVGPISRSAMDRLARRGSLGRDTLVWSEGMEDWTTLDQTELVDLLPPAA